MNGRVLLRANVFGLKDATRVLIAPSRARMVARSQYWAAKGVDVPSTWALERENIG